MAISFDEAVTGYERDAPDFPPTSFFLLIGDNVGGYSSWWGDYDAYAFHVDFGSNYTVVAANLTTNTDFFILDRYGDVLFSSVDYGEFSGFTFTALDELYYIVTYSDAAGYYRLRAENNSEPEINGIGEFVRLGEVYSASIDYTADTDHYLFNAVAGRNSPLNWLHLSMISSSSLRMPSLGKILLMM